MKRAWIFLVMSVALGGCATFDRNVNANAIAQSAGLERRKIEAAPFLLTAFVRLQDPAKPIDIYIEGDGLAWLSRYQVSRDPTPRKAVALNLAAQDPATNVVYLARPCQFTELSEDPACGPEYWTGRRFAPEVIASMNEAIGQLVAPFARPRINLVGYSGGGAVAVLIAARRKDIDSIRTVAGNLDHVAVNNLNRVSQLSGSLNAIDVANEVAQIPQIHFSGAEDDTVPASIAQRFAVAAGSRCVHIVAVPGADHDSGWVENWRQLLSQVPDCG